jgi:Raf kinase inhibitor-like YbhB/YbcL family protein
MKAWSHLALISALAFTAGTAWAAQAGLTLTSPDVAEGRMMAAEQVLNGFGCMGGNVSPALNWTGAPANTKSFALTIYDPDAPTGSGWWHWVVVDIPANAAALPKGWGKAGTSQLMGGRQTRTDFGQAGYGGPCPPPGTPHRYVFTLYALDLDKMDVLDDASGALVGFNIGAHTLAKAAITAQYGR